MNTATRLVLALLCLAVGLWLYQLGKADYHRLRTAEQWGQGEGVDP